MGQPLKVFISYSKHDKSYRDQLDKHLRLQKRLGKIQIWHDGYLQGGDEWDVEVKRQLETADLILFLVTSDFINTDYIWEVEVANAIERHGRKEARVIPIICRPCDWTSAPFGKLNALPIKGLPISTAANQDMAFQEVVDGLKKIIDAWDSLKGE